MRDEDLKPFFNLDEHAVEATFQTPEGTDAGEANVILSLPVGEMPVGAAGEVAHLQPSFQCATADIAGVKKGYKVLIDDAEGITVTYRVVRRENDGTGLSTVWLSKQ